MQYDQGVPGYPTAGAGQGRPIDKFSVSWKVAFFSAAVLVVVATTFELYWFLSDFEIFNAVAATYLGFFGLLMAVVDMPDAVSNNFLTEARYSIFKYFLFMTRFTGRGAWYLFLGSMLIATLWGDVGNEDLAGECVFALLFGLPVVILGLVAGVYGILKTRQLEAVRQSLKMREQEDCCPPQGMTKQEFSRMAIDIRGQSWDEEIMIYVLNALSLEIKADDHISKEEFTNWMDEPLMALL